MKTQNNSIRNIAIIAHVDHGKTTLVDHLFRQSGAFRSNQDMGERIMDSMDLERERGITIAAKNCSIDWKGTRINIIDTPGHADFGSEVERALMMADGALLLVDASEGPLPQTRFVLKKALASNLAIIVIINKIDRHDARAKEVLDEIYELFLDLEAGDHHIEFPVFFAIGRDGKIKRNLNDELCDLSLLLEEIIKTIPGPSYDTEAPFQMMVSDLGWSDFLGRLVIGKVVNGSTKVNEKLVRMTEKGAEPLRVVKMQIYQGITFHEVDEISPGDIVILAGVENAEIGDTVCHRDYQKALPRIHIDDPVVSMEFAGNTSPFSGKEGSIVQSSRILERLKKEALDNVGIQVEEKNGSFIVSGRGEFQMAILAETMRREGYEFIIGRPIVIFKKENGKTLEPVEYVCLDIDSTCTGTASDMLARRKGKMLNFITKDARVRLEYLVPSRTMIGFRNEFLTATRGAGLINTYLHGYEEYKGEFSGRQNGVMVSDRTGRVTPYALHCLEDRGVFFIDPGIMVYEGMIVGEHARSNDLSVNVTREKKLTNIRAANKDENVVLTPPLRMNLEKAIEYIADDECIEVTPLSIRIRKKILGTQQRYISGRIAQPQA
ncbi:MAG: GTP-binding protein TypA [Spirochaetes bacterium GWF1_41_5]|nr:MAG: GTP-binding protein TypA [Spirochaetes bacterium GWF1_41_5]HBE03531.1 translational GTPase TypA [Spirochaetia bacterium]